MQPHPNHMKQSETLRLPKSRLGCFLYCWRTTQRLMAHEETYYRSRTSILRSIYAFFEHRAFAEWVAYLNLPGNESARDGDRLVWYKTLRGYMTTDWDSARRVKVLKDTYSLMLGRPGPERDVIMNHTGVVLATEPLGDLFGDLIVELNHKGRFKREGELSISVICPTLGGELASIAFSYEQTPGGLVAYAGGLQGGLGANPASIKTSTRSLHGVRPKSLAIHALQWYLSSVGVSRLLAVRDSRQMSNKKHMIKTRWNRISFSYDEAWAESGGAVLDQSWYELPLNPRLKTRDEIKPNKRALYARRYAMYERLKAMISAKIASY